MKSYCHIEEFGSDRYNLLPIMVYCFEKAVIWGPNGSAMKQSHIDGKSYFSPFELLDLIDAGYLQVMGREEWFHKEERTPDKWSVSSWLEGFDSKLRDYGIADQYKPLYQRRVIMASKATGDKEAVKLVSSKSKENISLVDFIQEQVRNKNLPPRILEYSLKIPSDEKRLLNVLASIHNNKVAFELSEADIPIVLENADVHLEYIRRKTRPNTSINTSFAPDKVKELIHILQSLSISKNPRKFIKDLESNERRIIATHELPTIAASNFPIRSLFSAAVNRDIEEYQQKVGRDNFDNSVSIISLILSIIGFQISPISTLGLLFSLYSGGQAAREKRGLLPTSNVTYMLPYVFSCGKANPTFKDMEFLYNKLQEM